MLSFHLSTVCSESSAGATSPTIRTWGYFRTSSTASRVAGLQGYLITSVSDFLMPQL